MDLPGGRAGREVGFEGGDVGGGAEARVVCAGGGEVEVGLEVVHSGVLLGWDWEGGEGGGLGNIERCCYGS